MAAQINYDDKVISTQFGQITFGEVDNSNVVAGITIRAWNSQCGCHSPLYKNG